MRPRFQAISRYCPRVLTLIVLFLVAAPITLANFSFDYEWGRNFGHKSYGWPLHWHRYVDVNWDQGIQTVGWYFSARRLAGNLALWCVMTAVPAGLCEWLLRRYPPRLRWSLRTMLAAVGLLAAFCAWFATARNRASVQDPLITEIGPYSGAAVLVVERWGPKWLDQVGVDRFRRTIVAARLESIDDDEQTRRRLKQAARLPALKTLSIGIEQLTPEMTQAVSELRQLRKLNIELGEITDDDRAWEGFIATIGKMRHLEYLHLGVEAIRSERLEPLANLEHLKSLRISGTLDQDKKPMPQECLEAIGKLSQLERLELNYMNIRAESLACLAGLSNLQLLRLSLVSCQEPPLLRRLPALPRLNAIEITGFATFEPMSKRSAVGNEDLRHLAVLPRLDSLRLYDTWVTADGLKELAPLESLEELTIDDYHTSLKKSCVSGAGLESLLALKHLRKLHLFRSTTLGKARYIHALLGNGDEVQVLADDLDHFQRALESLRRAKPGIVIDAPDFLPMAAEWRDETSGPFLYDDDRIPNRPQV